MMEIYYLKPNIIAEPLVNQWYAHPFLISPTTAAMIVAFLHLRILSSYINNPEIHQDALRWKEMQGGPFIDESSFRVSDAKALYQTTLTELNEVIKFAQALKQGINLLKSANGDSIEIFYSKMPEVIRGYIELFYDIYSNPKLRVIEPLLYNSPYYLKNYQSVVLREINTDKRPFSLSTPRFQESEHIEIKKPFSDQIYDSIFLLKSSPKKWHEINDIFSKCGVDDAGKIKRLLTTIPPKSNKEKSNSCTSSVKVTYFGHACVLFQSNDLSILLDPCISYQYEYGIDRFTYADLPDKIDYVLITHNHLDHILIEHLIQLRHKITHIVVPKNSSCSLVDPSLKLLFKALGFKNVIELDELSNIDLIQGKITTIPFLGEHGDLEITSKTAYLIECNNKKFLFAADLNNLDPKLYENVQKITGDIEALYVSLECDGAPLSWLYGAFLPKPLSQAHDQSRRLDASDSKKIIELIEIFNTKNVYIYAMGQEPWLHYVMNVFYDENSKPMQEFEKLAQYCAQKHIQCEKLFGSATLNY